MQLSQREAERQERRATNLIWNSARDYSLAPAVRAYDTDGFADIYMNSIIGAVYKYYDFPKIKEVLDSFARTPKGDEFEELAWVALENCAFERAASERPALRELRLAYAQRIEAEAQRKGGARELDEAYRIKLEHYERALGMEPEMPERDRKILNALELSPELTTDEVVQSIRAVLREYYMFVATTSAGRGGGLPTLINFLRRRRGGIGAAVRNEDEGSGSDKQAKRVKERLVGERSETEMREYVEDCFGVSMYAPGELKRIEERLCSGAHWDSILHFTRGEMKPLDRNNREAIVQRSAAKRQAELNRKFYTDDIVRNRLTIARLSEKIRNCMLVHLDDARIKARAGSLAPEKVWRAVTLGDESVFTRPERGNDTELSVDILLDASASQIERQESVSTQAYMIAESLTRCGIPTRVYSFCTLNGCTVLRLFRDYEETNKNEAIFDYCAAGWNRDGLAFRAAGWMMRSSHCERRLLMILSDASPNDDRKLLVQETGKQELYRGQPGVLDSAAEVEKLRREGISVMCIFTGEDADLPSARRIYGRDLVRIRSIEQFADAVGGVVVQLIGNM
ncbi:MAG: hypothetical protein KH339_00220 [Firmicutes bacterium]|nr:hypothetical protein [Bacillota bacterium]